MTLSERNAYEVHAELLQRVANLEAAIERDNYIEVRMGKVYVKVVLQTEAEIRNALHAENWAQTGERFRLALARLVARADDQDRIAD